MGRITDNTKSIMPITWAALRTDDRVGDSVLASRVEHAEAMILGAVLSDPQEDALDALVVEYVAKYAALQIIPMAIDFWMDQTETVSTTGTHEMLSYGERIESLKELKKTLLTELARLEPIVTPLIPNILARESGSRPLLSTIDQDLLTPNPQDFGPIYAPPEAA